MGVAEVTVVRGLCVHSITVWKKVFIRCVVGYYIRHRGVFLRVQSVFM